MKLHILRLGSVVPDGVGGPEAAMLDLIYSYLLQRYNCDYYGHISINQVGSDLDEFIVKRGKRIDVNIRFPVTEFCKLNIHEQNKIRVEVIHSALVRIAEKEKSLDIPSLLKIKKEIFDKHFEFEFTYKVYENHAINQKIEILIQPGPDKFNFYVSVKDAKVPSCKMLVYEGMSNDYYIPIIFASGKWKNRDHFVIRDKRKEIELHIFLKECRYELRNLTNYPDPPFFEMMKANTPPEIRERVYKDWLHPLPPGISGIISHSPN